MEKIGNFYFHGKRDKKEVALTFDDGPSKETEEILKVLKKYRAKATFFIVGKNLQKRKKILKKIIKEGHEIGNHSFSHNSLWLKTKKHVEEDIIRCDKELGRFGVKTNLFRFPSFRFDVNSILVCKKLKKKVIFADVISNDWARPLYGKLFKIKLRNKITGPVKKVLNKVKKGSIINFHDYLEGIGRNKEIVRIIKEILPQLKRRGFRFVTVSKIIN